MGNELATLDDLKKLQEVQEASKFATDTALSEVTKVGNYLPFIALFGSNSKEVKRGDFPMGHFGFRESKSAITDLGSEVILLVISWRPKAMQYAPEVLAHFDVTSEAFKMIQQQADQKNSNKGFGPEFLVWVPELKRFATYFLGNKTGRNEAPNLIGPLKDKGPFVCIQKAKLIETNEYSWHGPTTIPYDHEIELPAQDKLQDEWSKFNNPPASVKEPAEADEDAESARR